MIADDTIIYGSGDSDVEAEKSHDAALMALLERCRKEGVKLNPIKFTIKKNPVSYIGHIFSAQGLALDLDKVKAISEMQRSTDIQDVQRLLGVVNLPSMHPNSVQYVNHCNDFWTRNLCLIGCHNMKQHSLRSNT